MGKNQSKIDLPMEDDPNLPFKLGAPVIDIVEHVGKSYPEIEFEKLEQKSKIPPGSCSEAFREQNKEKNRYHLVVPYDSTRVKLNPIENEEFSDYINASWVNVIILIFFFFIFIFVRIIHTLLLKVLYLKLSLIFGEWCGSMTFKLYLCLLKYWKMEE